MGATERHGRGPTNCDTSRIIRYRVALDDGRSIHLFVNRDTRLVVLDVIDANEAVDARAHHNSGVEILRRVV